MREIIEKNAAANRFTPRERQLLRLVRDGTIHRKDLAYEMGIAESTVGKMLHVIYLKTGRNDIAELAWSLAARKIRIS